MEPRFPQPRQKNTFTRPSRYGNPQYAYRPNLPSHGHVTTNNYEDVYPQQSPQLMVQTQDWQQPYTSTPTEHYASPTCSSPLSAPPMPEAYPPPMFNPPQPLQLPDGSYILNSQMYTQQQLLYFNFVCSHCKNFNIYWRIFHENKIKSITTEKDQNIAQLTVENENLQMELEKLKSDLLMTSTGRLNLNNNISVDDQTTLERKVNESLLSVHAPEFNYTQQNEHQLVPVVSANGDSTEELNYLTEERNLRVESSNHASDENINIENTEENIESPELKNNPITEIDSYIPEVDKETFVKEPCQQTSEAADCSVSMNHQDTNVNHPMTSNSSNQRQTIKKNKSYHKEKFGARDELSKKDVVESRSSGGEDWDVAASEKNESKRKIPEAEPRQKKNLRGRGDNFPALPSLDAKQRSSDEQGYKRHNNRTNRRADNVADRSPSNSRSKHSEATSSSYPSRTSNESPSSSGNNYPRYNSDRSRGEGGRFRRSEDRRQKEVVREVTGDLFTAPENFSLAHCVGSDFRMGSGIAVTFRQNFKRVADLLAQNAHVGDVAYLKEGERYIFYLVTKKFSKGKPTYESFRKALEDLMAKCVEFNVKHLAMPRIGCGLDRLEWKRVKPMINEIFGSDDMGIEIVVYNYEDGIQEKDYNKEQGKDKKGPQRALKVKETDKPLVEIEKETALLFLGTEDGHMDRTAQSLDKKFHFAGTYKSEKKTVGEVFRCEKNNEVLYSLIVRKTVDEPLNYTVLESCLKKLNKLLTTDQFVYVGFEAFSDPNDDTTMSKIMTLFRSTLKSSLELWICWPKDVENPEQELRRPLYPPYP